MYTSYCRYLLVISSVPIFQTSRNEYIEINKSITAYRLKMFTSDQKSYEAQIK